MANRYLLVAGLILATSACTPIRGYHGYVADEVQPTDIQIGVDTRSTVMAKLGSPSTTGMFSPGAPITADMNDDPSWVYITFTNEQFAYLKPEVATRTVTVIRFDDQDLVSAVEQRGLEDGQQIRYASRETPTRGRELGLLEQIFGTVGRVALPNSERGDPGDPTGSGRR